MTVGSELLSVEALCVLHALEDVVGHVHSGFMVETIGGLVIQLIAQELNLSSDFLCCLTSVLDLKTGEPEFEVEAEAEVELKCRPIEGPSGQENELTDGPVVLEPVLAASFEVLLVSIQLLLRINILKKLCLAPPPIIKKV